MPGGIFSSPSKKREDEGRDAVTTPLERLDERSLDLLVIGGGLSGASATRALARAGYAVALIERRDFGAGATGLAPRLLEGGLDTLLAGRLVGARSSLRARRALSRRAPQLVRPCALIVAGEAASAAARRRLALFELLSWPREGWPRPRKVKAEAARTLIPGLRLHRTREVTIHYDAVIDERRFALLTALDARRAGALLASRCEPVSLAKDGNGFARVELRDRLNGEMASPRARLVICATGAGSEALRRTLGLSGETPLLPVPGPTRLFLAQAAEAGAIVFDKGGAQPTFLVPVPGGLLLSTNDAATMDANRHKHRQEAEREGFLHLLEQVFDAPPQRTKILRGASFRPRHDVARQPLGGCLHVERFAEIPFVTFAVRSLARHEETLRLLVASVRRYLRPSAPTPHLAPTLPGGELSRLEGEIAAARAAGLATQQARWLIERYGAHWRLVLDGHDDPSAALTSTGLPLVAEIGWALREEAVRTVSDLALRWRLGEIAPEEQDAAAEATAREMARCCGWSPTRRERELQRWRDERDDTIY